MADTGTVAELDRRFSRLDGWLPPQVVTLLVACGHLDAVRRHASRGDWHCTHALARLRAADGDADAAVALLTPFAATGWWRAVQALTDLLTECGRTGEAVAVLRPLADAGDRLALDRLATLLAGQGLVDEAVTLLRPHTGDWLLAKALVRLTDGRGRDDEVIAILRTLLDTEDRRAVDRWFTVSALATVLERRGRVDEAIAVLRDGAPGTVQQLTDVLGRHGRDAQLHDLTAGAGGWQAAERLAALRERQGRIDEAVAVLRPFADDHVGHARPALAALLERHGRADESIAVLRTMIGEPSLDHQEWLAAELGDLLLRLGRPGEAVAVFDEIAAHHGEMWFELLPHRAPLLVACGRTDEAIAEVRAHPEGDTVYGAELLAGLLADAGRLDEAVEALWPHRADDSHSGRCALAELLIRQGRVDLAIDVVTAPREPPAQPLDDLASGDV
ncbi:tetratricopeptide repeat protein [Dactylosporangium sp. NBC_01737]|uniref:tetratricopeptide repeat protein n=1 Tax=Dactylosporangium sp. NBC_01737 TaxID=2975959 RepID=UPI002E0FA3AC|nr:tetratricopeptide repeat protein [Dactylosporangium sp. NBC_01737]